MSKPLLVQFGDLTPAHFTQHPVWVGVHGTDTGEPWYDDTDEETFRPWLGPLPASPEDGMLLVRATLTLADGTALPGFVTPQHDAEPASLGVMQPQLFLPSGRLEHFWDGMFPRAEARRGALYAELGKSVDLVFPLCFEPESGLTRGQAAGVLEGFYSRPRFDRPVQCDR